MRTFVKKNMFGTLNHKEAQPVLWILLIFCITVSVFSIITGRKTEAVAMLFFAIFPVSILIIDYCHSRREKRLREEYRNKLECERKKTE
jgi:c-di-AMP phosphodiesterase-like protein